MMSECVVVSCGEESRWNVLAKCSKCPKDKRKRTSCYCDPHLRDLVRKDITCFTCGSYITVLTWIRLPKSTEPAVPDRNNPVRVGDATRQSYTERLGDAFAGGFLTREEYDERMDKVPGSRFEVELYELVKDLPAPAPAVPVPLEPSGRLLSVGQWIGIIALAALVITCLAFLAL